MQIRTILIFMIVAIDASVSIAYAARCKDYSNCRQAVIKWCANQHPGADRALTGMVMEFLAKMFVDHAPR